MSALHRSQTNRVSSRGSFLRESEAAAGDDQVDQSRRSGGAYCDLTTAALVWKGSCRVVTAAPWSVTAELAQDVEVVRPDHRDSKSAAVAIRNWSRSLCDRLGRLDTRRIAVHAEMLP